MSNEPKHIPALAKEVIGLLGPKAGETVLDATLGLGGHALAFLERLGPSGKLIGLDADIKNLAFAAERLSAYAAQTDLRHANFGMIAELELPRVDILFADLGLSSPHVDDPSRGFTFRTDAPLDLRYDQSRGESAAELIRRSDEDDMRDIFRVYGELYKDAGKLSRMLSGQSMSGTQELKLLIEKGFGFYSREILPQIFQALRIAVNDELQVLSRLLLHGPELLLPSGRMGILSYHSLEDRMVKQAFKALCEPKKDDVTGKIVEYAPFELLTKKAIQSSPEEAKSNPRARSVKFRAIVRKAVPASA
jgi:16S rRNA (cytosine1402-N4)-methyltransferase